MSSTEKPLNALLSFYHLSPLHLLFRFPRRLRFLIRPSLVLILQPYRLNHLVDLNTGSDQKITRASSASRETIVSKVTPLVPPRRDWLPQGKKQWRALLLFLSATAMSTKAKKSSKSRRWSARVTRRSNALDLQPKVFRSTNPRKIALSLRRSAQASKRRKGTPYQSAMSMLNFYINRAGKSLPQKQKHVLERAKDELREVFGRA